MSNLRRIVFDTNVLISAVLIKNSISRRAFDRACQIGQILVSDELLFELNDVLKREKFEKYITGTARRQFVALLLKTAHIVKIDVTIRACRDPKDDKILELAVSGQADYLISGDDDLLTMHPFRDVEIITPGQFVELFDKK